MLPLGHHLLPQVLSQIYLQFLSIDGSKQWRTSKFHGEGVADLFFQYGNCTRL